MRRPLPFRVLPGRLCDSVFYRWYNPAPRRWYPLFHAAELRYAPGVHMRLVPTDVLHGCIAFTGVYERRLSKRVVQSARSGGLMVDVGANVGYFSLLWVALNSRNEVIAFEPSPRNVALLQHNIETNDFADRIHVHACAAGRQEETLEFAVGPDEQTGWGGFASPGTENTITVDVRSIDAVVGCDARVSLLKVDTEGADTWVLMGCERLLRDRRIAELHFEQNKPRMRALGIADNEAPDFLRSCGYDAFPLTNPGAAIVDWMATPAVEPVRSSGHGVTEVGRHPTRS